MIKSKFKWFAISAMLTLVFGVFLTIQPQESQAWARGKWMNVYAGSSTPQFQECASALATRCMTGDIRTLPKPAELAP